MRTRSILSVLVSVSAGCGGGVINLPKVNTPPVADTGGDQDAEVGQRVSLNGMASSDPDEDALTYVWTQLSGPPADLKDANSGVASFVATEDGIYEFLLTVSDDRSGTDESEVSVFVGEITVSGAPLADAGTDQTVDERVSVTLRGGNSADPDGDRLTFRWRQIAGPEISLSNPFTTEPTFRAPEVADTTELTFELRVEDEASNADTAEVLITVRNLDAPGSRCAGVTCPADEYCEAATGECRAPDRCTGITCETGETCDPDTGECTPLDRCAGVACSPGYTCDPATGRCAPRDRCAGVACSPGHTCDPATGHCQPYATVCNSDSECDDGLYCNGQETCGSTNGICEDGDSPCSTGQTCDEAQNRCVGSQACSPPSGPGGLRIADSPVGPGTLAFSELYYIEFDRPVIADTFVPGDVTVVDAGPDNSLDTRDDITVRVSPALSHARNRIEFSIAPLTGTLIAGRHYRVTLAAGCLRSDPTSDAFGKSFGLDGEFTGSFPSGDGYQGGDFVQEFSGIEQRVYATNTGKISGLAIHPIGGELYGSGLGGTYGPIPAGANVGNALAPIAVPPAAPSVPSNYPVSPAFPLGVGFSADGNTLYVTRGSECNFGNCGTYPWVIQKIALNGGFATSYSLGTSISAHPLHLRTVPPGYASAVGIVEPDDLIGVNNYAHHGDNFGTAMQPVTVIDVSGAIPIIGTDSFAQRVSPFSFKPDGALRVFHTPGNNDISLAALPPNGTVAPIMRLNYLQPFGDIRYMAAAGSFTLPDDAFVAVGSVNTGDPDHGTGFTLVFGNGVVKHWAVLRSRASDLVLSLDRTSAYAAIPDENLIVEFAGFPTN